MLASFPIPQYVTLSLFVVLLSALKISEMRMGDMLSLPSFSSEIIIVVINVMIWRKQFSEQLMGKFLCRAS